MLSWIEPLRTAVVKRIYALYIYILYLAVVRQSVMIQILLLIATSNKFLRAIPEKSSTKRKLHIYSSFKLLINVSYHMSQLKKRTKSSINYGLANKPYGAWLEEREEKKKGKLLYGPGRSDRKKNTS